MCSAMMECQYVWFHHAAYCAGAGRRHISYLHAALPEALPGKAGLRLPERCRAAPCSRSEHHYTFPATVCFLAAEPQAFEALLHDRHMALLPDRPRLHSSYSVPQARHNFSCCLSIVVVLHFRTLCVECEQCLKPHLYTARNRCPTTP